jgi:hypothetical protein
MSRNRRARCGDSAFAAGDHGKNRQVNHADAPQGALHRFGTDLAPWVLREFCAC